MFASKVLETARALGLEAASAAIDADLTGARLVLVDLERVSPEQLRQLRARASATLIGFGSHVAEATLADARAAGCDEVLSRGQFTARLPALLARARDT